MDWFKGKSTPETHGFLPSIELVGFSGEKCPIIQFYDSIVPSGYD